MLAFSVGMGKAVAMDAKEVLSNMQTAYAKAERLEYTSSYQLFKGHVGEDLAESYSAYVYKNNDQLYQKIGAVTTVYASAFMLQIDHEQKELLLNKMYKAPAVTMDLKTALSFCSETSCVLKNNVYEVILIIKPNASVPYEKMVLRIASADYKLLQMDLFYSSQQDFSETEQQDLHQPHLRISFSDISFSAKKKDNYFDLSTYVSASNDTLVVNNPYTGYNLQDNRPKY